MVLTGRQRAALAAAVGVGLVAGLGLFTFGYARGVSYLRDDPAACANCHVMREHFAAWQRGSHRVAATCNDCHTPHDLVGKYATKARNGFWHSFHFTTGRHPDPLRITPRNRVITEQACRHCHQPIVDAIDPAVAARTAPPVLAAALALRQGGSGDGRPIGQGADAHTDPGLSCIRCHTYVGHWVR